MRGLWKLGTITFIFACLVLYIPVLSCQRNSSQSVNLADFEKHFFHSYYTGSEKPEQRTYFEGSVSDIVRTLVADIHCCLDLREAAAYLEYMLENKGYSVNIIAGQDQWETGILIYDELKNDWVQWKWGTESLSDFSTAARSIDDWTNPKIYEDIYQVEKDSIGEYDWWNTDQADQLDEFAQNEELLPLPGFKVSNVTARVVGDSWELVEGEPRANVQISYIINRYGNYECDDDRSEVRLKIYDDNKILLTCPVPEDNLCRVSKNLYLDEGSHHIEVQISRQGTLAYGECYLDVHPASFYNSLRECTYSEVTSFLTNDITDQHQYDADNYNCRNFSCDVARNANSLGLKAAFIAIDYYQPKGDIEGHAIVCFDTSDEGLVFIEPQNDERIDIQFGCQYLDSIMVDIYTRRVSGEQCHVVKWPEMDKGVRGEFYSSLDEDTVADLILSRLSLAAEEMKPEDYIEDYTAAFSSDGYVQVASSQDEDLRCWDVLMQIGNWDKYEYGNEHWSSAEWKVWDDGVIVPSDINSLSIMLSVISD